jgi:anti-sigma regulatory factor (Ser/Thr protein kinase)
VVALEHTPALTEGDHVVQFYATDAELADVVVAYLVAAVADRDAVVAITTPEHMAAFTSGLASRGIDVDACVRAGGLVLLDAATTLRAFMVGGMPDRAAFQTVVGGVIRAATDQAGPVRAYGEMVALLWAEGNVAGALELERLWNDLGATLPFSLFCAYPADLVAGPELAEELAQVCHLHSAVVDTSPACPTVAVSHQFSQSSRAPREARQFVADALRRWGLDDLVDECQLVVSELATNAIRHAVSDFSISLSRVGSAAVHIAVGDGSEVPPAPRTPDANRPGGRGMHLIEAFSQRWGHSTSADGKLVWAVVGEMD